MTGTNRPSAPGRRRLRRAGAASLTVSLLAAAIYLHAPVASAAGVIEGTYGAPGTWAVTTSDVIGPDGTVIYKIFRPTDLGAGGYDHPIVTWGNGSWAVPDQYSGLLTHLASWGFVVVASTSTTTGKGTEMLAGAQYLVAQDATPGSVFEGRLDTANIAAVGHSQGAGGSVNATNASGGLIKTTIPINLPNRLWVSSGDGFEPSRLDGPVLFLTGSLDLLIAGPGTMTGYYDEVPGPAARAALKGAGHNVVQGTGGRFLGYVTAWLRYQLEGDAVARQAFVGAPPELNTNTAWTAQAEKHLP